MITEYNSVLIDKESSIDDAIKSIDSINSVITILVQLGQIPENSVNVSFEELPSGSVIYIVKGVNGFLKKCKTLPEASQAIIEAGNHIGQIDNGKIIKFHSDENKKLLDFNLASGMIVINKDYKFVIDLLATALLAAGLGALLGKAFKLEASKTALLAGASAVATKFVVDKTLSYEA